MYSSKEFVAIKVSKETRDKIKLLSAKCGMSIKDYMEMISNKLMKGILNDTF